MSAGFLVDTSAWSRSTATAELTERWTDLVASKRVALCPPVRLELLFSAGGPADYTTFAEELDGLPLCPLSRRAVDRAGDVQALLAARSHHRGPNAVDLFVAAIAEVNELTLVHYGHREQRRTASGAPMSRRPRF